MSNIMMAVANNSIRLGPIPFTLYRKDGEGSMVLFCKRGMPITDTHLNTISRMTLPLYISSGDMDDYLDYTFEKIEEIIGNRNIKKTERVSLLHKVAKRTLTRIIEAEPTKDAVKQSERFVKTTTEFIFSTPEVSMLLLDSAREDSYFFYHSLTNCVLAILLAKDLNSFDRGTIYDIGTGALLMDIGIPQIDNALADSRSPYSPEQWNGIRHHPEVGYRILKRLGVDEIPLDMVLHHHERMDGSGYPHGKTAENLSLVAQIAMVSDAYNINTSEKVYSHPEGHVYVLKDLLSKNKLFSPTVLNSLINVVLPDKESMQQLLFNGQ